MIYFTAQDNLGIRDLYAQVIDKNGNPVKYGKVEKFPAEVGSGKPDNTFYTVELPPLNPGTYTIKLVAVDFYGNKAVVTKEINIKNPTATTSPTTTSSSAKKGVCGPAALIALAILPLLMRKRK